jgi:putative chitinase
MAEEKRDAEPVIEQNQPQGFIEALSSIDASVTNLVGLLPALVTAALRPPPSDGEETDAEPLGPSGEKLNEDASRAKPLALALFAALGGIITGLTLFGKDLFTGIKETMTTFIESAKAAFENIKEFMSNLMTSIVAKLKEVTEYITQKVVDGFNSVSESIQAAYSTMIDQLGNAITMVANGVKEAVDNMLQNVSGLFDGIKNIVTNLFSEIQETVFGALSSAADTVEKIMSSVGTWVLDKLKAASDMVSSALGKLVTKFNDFREAIKEKIEKLGKIGFGSISNWAFKGLSTQEIEQYIKLAKKQSYPVSSVNVAFAKAALKERKNNPQEDPEVDKTIDQIKKKPVVIKGDAVQEQKAQPQAQVQKLSGPQALVAQALAEKGITDPKAVANVLATVQAESGFKARTESLNYRPGVLAKYFAKYFPGGLKEAEAVKAQGEEAIGNRIYGGRMGNAPDEGYKFRGRGFIQHTGKNQYEALSNFINMDLISNPDKLNDPAIAAKAIPWFFLSYKGLKPKQLEDINRVNKAVGFRDDKQGTKAAQRVLLAQEFGAQIQGATIAADIEEPNMAEIQLAELKNADTTVKENGSSGGGDPGNAAETAAFYRGIGGLATVG